MISADSVGWTRLYLSASLPIRLYPDVLIVISVPTLDWAKAKEVLSTRLTWSPVLTPVKIGVPDTVASWVPSYSLSSPVKPTIVRVVLEIFNGIWLLVSVCELWESLPFIS